jgi:hypothetical protein
MIRNAEEKKMDANELVKQINQNQKHQETMQEQRTANALKQESLNLESQKLQTMYNEVKVLKNLAEILENDNKTLKIQSWISTIINIFLAFATTFTLLSSIFGWFV